VSMDEQSGSLAGETTPAPDAEIMSEPVAHHQNEELRKRRSTRIMQAVPLAVTGVDALGRPFTERTSTLIINCHGCRYQSKHYVLKNMWVTLGVPHSEAGQPPRSVRGRVAWIQRPRTVRQLFQVALELETPGNTWGIAFPPPDWFAPQAMPKVPVVTETAHLPLPDTNKTEIHLPLTDLESGSATVALPDNLRVFPAPASATDASLQLARHMSRLVADAKQQLQAAARDIAAQAVGAERRIATDEWEQKLAASREQLAQQLSSALQKIQDESDARWRAAHNATGEALQRDLPGWIAPQLEQLTRELAQQISERGAAERNEHSQHVAGALAALRTAGQQAEEAAARLRSQFEETHAQLTNRAAESARTVEEASRQAQLVASAQRQELAAAADELQSQVKSSLAQSGAAWQGLLDTELSAAEARLRSSIEASMASAQEQASAVLGQRVETLAASMQEDAARRAAAAHEMVNQAFAEAGQQVTTLLNSVREEAEQQAASVRESLTTAIAGAEQQIAGLRDALRDDAARQTSSARESIAAAAAQAEDRMVGLRHSLSHQSQQLEALLTRASESTEHLENFSVRMDTTQRQALAGFESQIDDVLTLHRNELHRRSETLLEEINARIHSNFEESCQRAVSRFDQQIDALVEPHISRTEQAIHRLAGGRSLLDAALTLQQDRIRASADEAFAESLARFRENLGGVEQLLQDAETSVTARNLADYESKIADLKHRTVDDLVKSAEWYEKKAQTQIQHFTERTVEQAENQFREKAGEVSSVFASELDHSSRSFIGHTQQQMEEVVRDAFERSRALFTEAAETTTAAFTDEIQRQARGELDGFTQETQRVLNDTQNLLGAARAALAQQLTAEQESFLRQFRARMTGAIDIEVSGAQEKAQSSLNPLLESWKSTVETHRHQMQSAYQELSNHAAELHRTRLENVSNQWMLATVASLNQQSREAVSSIAAIAEDKLRETCAQVFANVGESLRERLQQIAAGFTAHAPQPQQETKSPESAGLPQSPFSRSTTAGSGD
jgi:hypothetical protein